MIISPLKKTMNSPQTHTVQGFDAIIKVLKNTVLKMQYGIVKLAGKPLQYYIGDYFYGRKTRLYILPRRLCPYTQKG